MDESAAYRLEQLVAETTWLRRLARSLVADAASADDVTHDTLVAAAQHSVPDNRPLRPWLARVARNVARMRGRSAARRAMREARSASDETAAQPDQLLERVEMQRLLTSYVLELEAGDRDVILLHFFEGLSSAEIGRRLGIPDGTVRWRLKRGLDALRSRLDVGGSRRGAWIAPIAALGRAPMSAGKVALVKKVLVIVILAIAVLAIGVAVWRRGSTAGEQGGGTSRSAGIRAGARVPSWVIQPELAARQIAGRVVFRGVAMPKARVSLRIAQQPDVAIADVVSDDYGMFSFGGPPSAAYTVIARAPGTIAAIVEVDTHDPRAHPDRLELVLGECVARAVGTVSDAEGAPIAKARVGERGLVGVETDDHGRYELCRSPSTVSVTFAATGFGSVTTSFEGPGELVRHIVLAPEGVILGRVVRAGSLAAVAGADVVAINADGTVEPIEIPPVSAKSSDDGRFQLGGLAPGRYRVGATAPGLGGALVETFVAGANTRELTIVVDERTRVKGTVVSNGEPLEGVEVTSVGPAHLSGAAPVFSQHDGSFAIDGVPHGEVHWRVRGYRVLSPVATTVIGDHVEKVVLDVVPGRSIRGHVTRDGVAAVGAAVRYWHLSWNGGFHNNLRTAITDALGAYSLDDIELGRTGVAAQTADATSADHIVDVGEEGAIVDITLDQSASVSGNVVDEHGVPVVGVDVVVSSHLNEDRYAISDAVGHFEIKALHAGDFSFAVTPDSNTGYDRYQLLRGDKVHLATDSDVVTNVQLEIVHEQRELRGVVVDDGGSPLADVRVWLSDARSTDQTVVTALLPPSVLPNPGVVPSSPSTLTDLRGGFHFSGLPKARYSIRAFGADGGQAVVEDVESGATSVRVVLASGGSIEGSLAGFGPSPMINATNHLDATRVGAVDGDHFRITGLRAGSYSITAQDDRGGDAQTIDVASGSTAHVALSARGTGRITLHVTVVGTGAAAAQGRCIAAPSDHGLAAWWNSDGSGVSDSTGRCTLTVPAGKVRAIFRGSAKEAGAERDIDVPANREVTVELEAVANIPGGAEDPAFTMLDDVLPATILSIRGDPARSAGLAAGDQIISVDGISTALFGPAGVEQLLANHAPGTAAMIGVMRGSARLTITLLLH